MSQLNEKHAQDEKIILRNVLHVIAASRDMGQCVPPILNIAQSITGAAGAVFVIFSEPQLVIAEGVDGSLIPQDDTWQEAITSLGDGLHVNPDIPGRIVEDYAGWLVAPIRIQKGDVGALALVFNSLYALSEDDHDLLRSLVDSLTIVTRHARSQARHERLTRNQSEFTRLVSHDLRSPLTSMQGFASMLESNMVGDLNERQAHFVEKILSGIAQMTSLVDNIQDAGRYDPETGFYEMERSPCDLIEVANRIVNNHLVPAEKQELTISVTSGSDVPIINADPNMLERALTNLVDNAIKYTPNGGKIEVGVRRDGGQVVLSVTDTGYGISPENQKHLFERHVRIPRKEHKRVKGSGLGLFIVRSVAQRHGGRAWVESVEGKGSTFYMSIPLDGANLVAQGSSATP